MSATAMELIEALKITEQAKSIARMLGEDPATITIDQGVMTLQGDIYAKSLAAAGLNLDDAQRYHQHDVDFIAGTTAVATVSAIDHMAKNQDVPDVLLTVDMLPGVKSFDASWQRSHRGYDRTTREHVVTPGNLVVSITSKDSVNGPGPLSALREFSRKLAAEQLKDIAKAL